MPLVTNEPGAIYRPNRAARRKLGEPWKPLEERLLAIGGKAVEFEPLYRAFLVHLGVKGVHSLLSKMHEYPTEGLTVVAGWPGACDLNTLPRWLNGEGDLIAGFALRAFDQTWWPNNWIARPDGTVLDSLAGHAGYFGRVCNDPDEWGPSWHELVELYRAAQGPYFRPWITLVPVQPSGGVLDG